jgi:hypothetical protein
MMIRATLISIALLLTVAPASADTTDPTDSDMTVVKECEALPRSVTIVVMSSSDTLKVCREMLRVLEGVRNKDITMFEKFAAVLQNKGYDKGYVQIVSEQVEIIRLRGLYDKPDRWQSTMDISWRSWVAFHGAVAPTDTIDFLRGLGEMASTLDDDGLTKMLIVIKRLYQSGK